ncbi:helix-turn-helix domain-containing protein [Streptomyces sp. NPDC005820]|uniref:nSTAND1 domain-containing NTPase n=1 Tax=Streptomyces sp. NPDC005820 TaxID=3157069 RepID=UPI0033C2B354
MGIRLLSWGNAVGEDTAAEDFAAALRRIRRERGLSLSELSDAVTYSKSHLSNIEHGRKRPHSALAEALDAALGSGTTLRRLCATQGTLPGQRATPCPYRGLAPYGPDDARWFFGRARATAALVDRVAEAVRRGDGPVLVCGASGSGKSSLLRAGLLPAVADGALPPSPAGPWRAVVLTPTARPVDVLARALAGHVQKGGHLQEAAHLQEAERTLAARIRAGTAPTDVPGLLLVVDQFEEAFTLCADPAERGAFIDAVCALPLAVIAVRADFFDHCLTHPALVGAVQRQPMALGAMSRSELAECVTRPAELAGLEIEPGLLDVLLHDLDPCGRGHEPGILPLLSYALLATWQQRTGRRLTVVGYRRTGGIQGAVATTAERTYLDLGPEQRDTARQLTLQLVRVGEEGADSRRHVERRRLVAGADAALEAFTRARLFTVDGDRVEITHEALLRAWPRLAGWIDADRAGLRTHQRLTDAAHAWAEGGRRPELLLQGAVLAVAEQWAADHPRRLTPAERGFLTDCRREADRGVRRLRRALAALAGLLALLLIATSLAVTNALTARQQAREARAVAMTERIAALRTVDPALAATLSVAARRTAPRLPAARGALLSSTGLPHPTPLPGNDATVSAFAFGRDGLTAVGTREGVVRLWRGTRQVGAVRLGARHAVWGLAFAGDGERLVVADTVETRLWRVRGGSARRGPVLWADGGARDARIAPDGRTLAVAGADGTLRLWDLDRTRRRPAVHRASEKALYSVSFSRDGSRLATGGLDGHVTVWTRGAHRLAYAAADRVTFTGASVGEAALSPDGRRLAAGLADRDVWLCDLDREGRCAAPRRTAQRAEGYTAGMAFSPDASLLAVAGEAGGLQLRHPVTGLVLATLAHPTPLLSLAWGPGGRTLYAGAAGSGTASVWPFPLPQLLGHAGQVYAVALDDRHARAATAALDGTAALWDVHDPARPRRSAVLPHHTWVTAVAFDRTGTRLATGARDGTLTLWDVRSVPPRRLGHRRLHRETVNDLAFSPDGTRLASGARETGARLWDVSADGGLTARARLAGEKGVQGVAFGLGGRVLATGEGGGVVRLWDARGRGAPRPLWTRAAHTAIVTDVAFADRGGLLASGGKDGAVLLWRLAPDDPRHRPAGTPRQVLGHTRHIAALAFARHGRTLLTAGEDGTALLWSVDRAAPVLRERLDSPGETFGDAAVSADGRTVLTAVRYTARVWTTGAAEAERRVCASVGTPLTETQWRLRLPGIAYQRPCPENTSSVAGPR